MFRNILAATIFLLSAGSIAAVARAATPTEGTERDLG